MLYIRLENNMLTEGQFPDFRIKEVYEDKKYKINLVVVHSFALIKKKKDTI